MGFQTSVNISMPKGKQNAHLIAYQQDGVVDSFVLDSERVNSNGSVDLALVQQEIQKRTKSYSEITILGVSPLGAQ